MFFSRICSAATLLLFAAPLLPASSFSFNGSFLQDDSQFLVQFNLGVASTVTLESYSYGGGVDPLLGVVPAGGFAAVLSIFDPAGNLLAFDDGGVAPAACGPRSIDPVTNFCLDAFMQLPLSPGTYSVVLTEYDNTPNGPTLADGFAEQGNGNFTGPNFLGQPGSFRDPFGNPRTANYDFNISGVTSIVPEPSCGVLFAAGLGLLFVLARSRARAMRAFLAARIP